ncbi:MAG: HipA family kinase, partial [Thermomicrobiales bacterium]
ELDPEKQEDMHASQGLVFGSLEIPGISSLRRGSDPPITPREAAAIVWFDSLVVNADRKWRNPNILTRANEFWVIDNDSAFHLHHRWADPARRSAYQVSPIDGTTWWAKIEHVLLPWASSIAEAGDELAGRLDATIIANAVDAVPELWFAEGFPDGCTMPPPDAYREFLLHRLTLRRDFEALADHFRLNGTCAERV